MACRLPQVILLVFAVAHGLHTPAKPSRNSLERPSESFATMMCSSYEGPRDAALCLAGTARSFPHRLVHQSVAENVLGGSFGVPITPFLHVARSDARGDAFSGGPDVFPDWAPRQILDAAHSIGIADDDIAIVDGHDQQLPTCPEYQADFEERKRCEAGEKSCGEPHTMSYLNSLAGALSHRKGCMDLISAKESKKGSKFDLIILARADLTWYLPLRPHCLYEPLNNLNKVEGDNFPGLRFWDWLFMFPRNESETIFVDLYNGFYNCTMPFNSGDRIERYLSYGRPISEDESFGIIVTRKPGSEHSLCKCARCFGNKVPGPDCKRLIDSNEFNS